VPFCKIKNNGVFATENSFGNNQTSKYDEIKYTNDEISIVYDTSGPRLSLFYKLSDRMKQEIHFEFPFDKRSLPSDMGTVTVKSASFIAMVKSLGGLLKMNSTPGEILSSMFVTPEGLTVEVENSDASLIVEKKLFIPSKCTDNDVLDDFGVDYSYVFSDMKGMNFADKNRSDMTNDSETTNGSESSSLQLQKNTRTATNSRENSRENQAQKSKDKHCRFDPILKFSWPQSYINLVLEVLSNLSPCDIVKNDLCDVEIMIKSEKLTGQVYQDENGDFEFLNINFVDVNSKHSEAIIRFPHNMFSPGHHDFNPKWKSPEFEKKVYALYIPVKNFIRIFEEVVDCYAGTGVFRNPEVSRLDLENSGNSTLNASKKGRRGKNRIKKIQYVTKPELLVKVGENGLIRVEITVNLIGLCRETIYIVKEIKPNSQVDD
jgi:hypothetical protein